MEQQESGQEWQLKADPVSNVSWELAGKSPGDSILLGTEIAQGSRLYRAIVVDKKGRQTLNNWEAVFKVFDNRLEASEIRQEMFRFSVPADLSGKLEVEATLRYLRYPAAFATDLGMTPANSVLVAIAAKIIDISN